MYLSMIVAGVRIKPNKLMTAGKTAIKQLRIGLAIDLKHPNHPSTSKGIVQTQIVLTILRCRMCKTHWK